MESTYKYKNNKKTNIVVFIIAGIILLTSIFVIVKVLSDNAGTGTKHKGDYVVNIVGKNYYQRIDAMTDGLFEYGTEEYERVHVIHDIVAQRCEYDIEGYDNADDLLFYQNGNSVAYANLFKDLCNECGIPCEVVSGFKDKYTNKTAWCWNVVTVDEMGYYVDVCTDDIHDNYDCFLLSCENFLSDGYMMSKNLHGNNANVSYEILRSKLDKTDIEFVEGKSK